MGKFACDICHDTGWYGDNGPGIAGNNEYVPCDCAGPKKIMADLKTKLAKTEATLDQTREDAIHYAERCNELLAACEHVQETLALAGKGTESKTYRIVSAAIANYKKGKP